MQESVPCTARTRHEKRPCKNQAIKGAEVCRMHGGATRQVKRKAQERRIIASVGVNFDRRHPWEVLADAVHVADALMRTAIEQTQRGQALSLQDIDRVALAVDRASRIAKMTLDTRADEFGRIKGAADAELLARVMNAAIEYADLDDDVAIRLRTGMRRALLKVEDEVTGRPKAIEGQVVRKA